MKDSIPAALTTATATVTWHAVSRGHRLLPPVPVHAAELQPNGDEDVQPRGPRHNLGAEPCQGLQATAPPAAAAAATAQPTSQVSTTQAAASSTRAPPAAAAAAAAAATAAGRRAHVSWLEAVPFAKRCCCRCPAAEVCLFPCLHAAGLAARS